MPAWSEASLVIQSETVGSEELTRRLGVEPTRVREKGTRKSRRDPASPLFEATVWTCASGAPKGASIEDKLSTLLDEIEPASAALVALTERCEEFLFLGLFGDLQPTAFRIGSPLWQRMARLPAPVVLDPYPPHVDDEDEIQPGPPRKWTAGFLKVSGAHVGVAEITRALGRDPYAMPARGPGAGDGRGPAGLSPPTDLWQIESGVAQEGSLEGHLASLLEKVEPHADVLRALARECELSLSLGFAAENGQGSGWFDQSLVGRLARLPLDVTLHLYSPYVDVRRSLAAESA